MSVNIEIQKEAGGMVGYNSFEEDPVFYFLRESVQEILENQLVRLSEFKMDFDLTRIMLIETLRLDGQAEKQKASPHQSKTDLKKGYGEELDRRKAVHAIIGPLVTYAKDIVRNKGKLLSQTDSLKKKSGLGDFLEEINTCEKALLRIMKRDSPQLAMYMYLLDFMWKMVIVRMEYHLEDEELRLRRVERFYKEEKAKEVEESFQSFSIREAEYLNEIKKLRISNEELSTKCERLMNDKVRLGDTIADKDQEIHYLSDPYSINSLGTLNAELELYIKSLSSMKEEQSLALQGLKGFIDQMNLEGQRQPRSSQLAGPNPQVEPPKQEPMALQAIQQKIEDKQKSSTALIQQSPDPLVPAQNVQKSKSQQRQGRQKRNQSKYRAIDENLISPQIAYIEQLAYAKSYYEVSQISDMYHKSHVIRTSDVHVQTLGQHGDDEDPYIKVCSNCQNLIYEEEGGDQEALLEVQTILNQEADKIMMESNQQTTKVTGGGPEKPWSGAEKVQQQVKFKKQPNMFGGAASSSPQTKREVGVFITNQQLQNKRDLLHQNDDLKKTAILNSINVDSKEIIMMPETTLIKHIHDVFEKKFEQDQRIQTQLKTNPYAFHLNILLNVDILIFTYNHFLAQQGLKSLALKYLNSIYTGLEKIYARSPDHFQYCQFLMQLFGFNPDKYSTLSNDQVRIVLKTRKLFQLVQKKYEAMPVVKKRQVSLMVTGGEGPLFDLLEVLYKACGSQLKGFFSQVLLNLKMPDVDFPGLSPDDQDYIPPDKRQRLFVSMKFFALIKFARTVDAKQIASRSENGKLVMDMVMNLISEEMERQFDKAELGIFKKEFSDFYQVPEVELKEKTKMVEGSKFAIQVSLVTMLARILEEYEVYQNRQRKQLLKVFIDFDENGDGVLTLDEFRELIKSLEGQMPMDKMIQLFNEALDSSENALGKQAHPTFDEEEQEENSDKMQPEAFVEMIIRNKIGGYGKEPFDFAFLEN